MMKTLRYRLEALFLHFMMLVFRVLPLDRASAFGGWIGRTLGPKLAASRKARTNLSNALPHLGDNEKDRIIKGMWENLGRVMAEYPHLGQIARERVKFIDATSGAFGRMTAPNVKDREKRPHIFFTAHMANWEISAAAILVLYQTQFDIIYREPNNPYVRDLLDKARSLGGQFNTYPKSRTGMRQVMKLLRGGGNLGILIDQKYNEGISMPFFGLPAMTSPAFAELAQKYNAVLLPGRLERLDGAHFHITVNEPMALTDANGAPRPAEDMIAEAHAMLERWIAERPEQWLWLHKRWAPNPRAEAAKAKNLAQTDTTEKQEA